MVSVQCYACFPGLHTATEKLQLVEKNPSPAPNSCLCRMLENMSCSAYPSIVKSRLDSYSH